MQLCGGVFIITTSTRGRISPKRGRVGLRSSGMLAYHTHTTPLRISCKPSPSKSVDLYPHEKLDATDRFLWEQWAGLNAFSTRLQSQHQMSVLTDKINCWEKLYSVTERWTVNYKLSPRLPSITQIRYQAFLLAHSLFFYWSFCFLT